jgi:hypothetical protein
VLFWAGRPSRAAFGGHLRMTAGEGTQRHST